MRGNKFFRFIDKYVGIFLLLIINLLIKIFPKKNIVKNIKMILIIKLSAMGDTILLIPLIKTLKKNFPDSEITMVVTDINKQVVNNLEYLSSVLEFDVKKNLLNIFSFLNFIKKIKEKKFDLSIDCDQWLRISAILSFLSGAKMRIGFKTKNQFKHFLFTNFVYHNSKKHELECFFDLVKVLNLKNIDKNLEFKIEKNYIEEAKKHLEIIGIKNDDKFIVIVPEVPLHGYQRSWPKENFLKVAEMVIERFKDINVIFITTKKFFDDKEKKESVKIKFLSDISLNLVAAIILKSKLLVCCNTGIMHLGSALGVPIVALHGPTDYLKWGPLGDNNLIIKSKLSCSPCLYLGFEYKCKTNNCMKSIPINEVYENIEKLLIKIL